SQIGQHLVLQELGIDGVIDRADMVVDQGVKNVAQLQPAIEVEIRLAQGASKGASENLGGCRILGFGAAFLADQVIEAATQCIEFAFALVIESASHGFEGKFLVHLAILDDLHLLEEDIPRGRAVRSAQNRIELASP